MRADLEGSLLTPSNGIESSRKCDEESTVPSLRHKKDGGNILKSLNNVLYECGLTSRWSVRDYTPNPLEHRH